MGKHRKFVAIGALIALLGLMIPGYAGYPDGGQSSISPAELQDWLGYISSDELEGRDTFSEGLGLAAAYITDHLREWGIHPAAENGKSYLQTVRVLGVKSANHSTVTVEANGQTRTFENGAGISLPPNSGGKRTVPSDQVEFLGYGLDAPLAGHTDYKGKEVKNKIAVWLGDRGPKGLDLRTYFRALFGRSRYATEQQGALASIGPEISFGRRGGQRGQQQGGGPQQQAQPANQQQAVVQQMFGARVPVEEPDFTTVQRLDDPIPPSVSAQDDFFTFLFNGQEATYADLKDKAEKQEALPSFTLKNVKITININADYRVVKTQLTHNVVGILEGSDPQLKDTYVAFGAHYDHVGYAQGEVVETKDGPRRAGAVGRVTDGAIDDRIWNGADDDGSGTVTEMAIAKAFATGPKPKRSILFVWHTGEEKGLWGSRYFADYPLVPMDRIVAQINMDMVGRNNNNGADEQNTVYLVGDDRISTELHNIIVDADAKIPSPLTLNYEMNDPNDLEQVYYRSDHYSYASKGIPIVFLTTGLHPDYHANTDSAEKILYPKMANIGKLAYQVGWQVANLEHAPARDFKGPRVGKGSSGKLEM
ncbi:MAG TPA: M28 family peptidase [Blastocatellia bacterium]|nr:M28 family peptidase [Blastocatellia bacterium]